MDALALGLKALVVGHVADALLDLALDVVGSGVDLALGAHENSSALLLSGEVGRPVGTSPPSRPNASVDLHLVRGFGFRAALWRYPSPVRTIVIADVDGTLVDSNYQNILAWYRAFRGCGVTVP